MPKKYFYVRNETNDVLIIVRISNNLCTTDQQAINLSREWTDDAFMLASEDPVGMKRYTLLPNDKRKFKLHQNKRFIILCDSKPYIEVITPQPGEIYTIRNIS